MAHDSGAKVLLFQENLEKEANAIKEKSGSKIELIAVKDAVKAAPTTNVDQPANGNDPFYMVYTSVSAYSFHFIAKAALIPHSREARASLRACSSLSQIRSRCCRPCGRIIASPPKTDSSSSRLSVLIFPLSKFSLR